MPQGSVCRFIFFYNNLFIYPGIFSTVLWRRARLGSIGRDGTTQGNHSNEETEQIRNDFTPCQDIRYFKPILDSRFHAVDSLGTCFGFLVSETWILDSNRTFYRYGGHIELIRFKEYYGMPRGHSPSIYGRFSGKQRTSLYISREKGNHCYIQTRHNDLFFPLQSFSWKLTEKLARKVRVNTQRVYWIVLMPLGHPIILLKSNKFNMAAVSVKGSIVSEILDSLS